MRQYFTVWIMIIAGILVPTALGRSAAGPETDHGFFPRIAFAVEWKDSSELERIFADLKAHHVNTVITGLSEEDLADAERMRGLTAAAERFHIRLAPEAHILANLLGGTAKSPESALRTLAGDLSTMMFPSGYRKGYYYSSLARPDVRERARRILRRTMDGLGNSPALACLDFDDEPVLSYIGEKPDYQGDYSAAAMAGFTKKTGLEAPRLSSVEIHRKYPPGTIIAEDDPWLRWNLYRLGLFETFYRELAREAHRTDPRLPVTTQLNIGAVAAAGISWPCVYRTADVVSFHAYPYRSLQSFTLYAQDLARSVTHDTKPGWLTVQAFDPWGTVLPPELVRLQLWQAVAGGARGIGFFLYNARAEAGDAWKINGRPETWAEIGRVYGLVEKLAPRLLAMKPEPRPVALLQSTSTEIVQGYWTASPLEAWKHWHSNEQAYAVFTRAGVPVEIVTEDDVLNGRLKKYRAIVLVNVENLRKTVLAGLERYGSAGGLIYADDSTAVTVKDMKRLGFAVNQLYEAFLKKPGQTARDRRAYQAFVNEQAECVARTFSFITPSATCDSRDIILRTLSGKKERLLFAINNSLLWPYGEERLSGRVLESTIVMEGDLSAGDALTGQPLPVFGRGGKTSLQVTIPPGDAVVIRLQPK